jgi:hypothetical protein
MTTKFKTLMATVAAGVALAGPALARDAYGNTQYVNRGQYQTNANQSWTGARDSRGESYYRPARRDFRDRRSDRDRNWRDWDHGHDYDWR